MIALSDGSFGLMPEEWLHKYGLLASVGEVEEDHLRFKQTQTGLLDALLASRPEITCDETFARVREDWRNFRGITAVAEPPGFVGTLREYQREGLGWFEFLRHFKFGGCLADDMGLGKTVQVLAMLESRRNGGKKPCGKGFITIACCCATLAGLQLATGSGTIRTTVAIVDSHWSRTDKGRCAFRKL